MTKSEQKFFDDIMEDMKKLGTYHSSFDRTIERYIELQNNIEKLKKSCKKNKIDLYADTSEDSCILFKRLESMEKELQMLNDRLCLSPKSFKTNIRKDGHRNSDISTHAPNNTERKPFRLLSG